MRTRTALTIGVPVVLYLAVVVITGTGGWLHDHAPLGIVLLGSIEGVVYALGAFGLILIYRSNRFINFAHGALGSLVGVICIGMVLQHHVSYWVMLPTAVVGGAAVGALTEFAVIRRFRNSSRLIITVASIGLAQLFGAIEIGGSRAIKFTSLVGAFKPPLNVSRTIDHVVIGGDHVLVLIVAPLVILALGWFLLRTDAGIGVRAAAENVDRALLLGIPVRRLATIVWAIAGGLAALSFMLTASFQGVKPGALGNGPTVLLPLLAVAVVARMESLPLALGSGIGLGIVESLTRWNSPQSAGLINLVYLIVILGALLLQRGKLSRAQESGTSSWSMTSVVKPIPAELKRFPEVRWVKVGLLLLVTLALVFIPKGWSLQNQNLATTAMVWAMVGVSLVVLTGWGGDISLGQFGIVGLGGIVAANMVSSFNMDMFFVLLIAGAAGGAIALLVGLPALRIRGLFLAVTTLAFAIAMDSFFLNKKQSLLGINFSSYIPDSFRRPLLWQRFDLNDNYHMYLVALAFLALAILASLGVRKARSGRVVIATRDNQRAADAASVPTTSIKLSGFLLAGVIAGIAGGLLVMNYRTVGEGTGTFQPIDSITVFAIAVIGGLGSITGAITGVFVFRWIETWTWLGEYRAGVEGVGLLLVLYFLPGGFGQIMFWTRDRYLRWVADRHDIVVPSLIADKRTGTDGKAANEVGLLQGALAGKPSNGQPEPRELERV